MDWLEVKALIKAQGLEESVRQSEEKGREEGRVEGREKGVKETARNLLAMGIDVDTIRRATGLSTEEISSLR